MTSRDKDFYFADLVIFSVEDVLFRVPRTAFEKGSESFFATLFSLPAPNHEVTDGQSDAQPLRLEGIKANEFMIFLRALYPSIGDLSHLLSSSASDFAFTKEEYIIILKFSIMWDFQKLREAVITRLGKLLVVDNELLTNGVTYHVDSWKVRGFGMLVSRAAYLSYEEMRFMVSSGDDLLWKYNVVRDCCRNRSTQQLYPSEEVKCSSGTPVAKSVFEFSTTPPPVFTFSPTSPTEARSIRSLFPGVSNSSAPTSVFGSTPSRSATTTSPNPPSPASSFSFGAQVSNFSVPTSASLPPPSRSATTAAPTPSSSARPFSRFGAPPPKPTEKVDCNRVFLVNLPTRCTIKHTAACDSARKALGLILVEADLEEIDRSKSR